MVAKATKSGTKSPTLPMCLPYVTNSQKKEAKMLIRTKNWFPKRGKRSLLLPYTPKDVEEIMFLNICARQYDEVWKLAEKIKRDPISLRYRTTSTYLLLLFLITAKGNSSHAIRALTLYQELYSDGLDEFSIEEHELAAKFLLSLLRKCSDFTLLLPLKAVYESILVQHLDTAFEAQYIGAALNILINSHQYNKALDLFESYMAILHETEALNSALTNLPVIKLLDYMAAVQDCDSLVKWLKVVTASSEEIITPKEWSTYLGLSLSLNHYNLVKLIYEQWIMAGMETHLSVEDVVLNNKISKLESLNTAFQSLSDGTLYQILQCLASHGDVDLTLNLIEWHYIHKTMKGEKALTKELCIDIIHSYCFYNDTELDQQGKDHSMERVLDVLDSFISRQNRGFELSYKDISDGLSHKMYNYKAEDENVTKAEQKEAGTHRFIESLNEETSTGVELPRKSTNKNISESTSGNLLLNTQVLRRFAEDHINYLLKNSASTKTIELFISCLLNHLNKLQNCSGIISALQTLKLMNDDFINEWIASDLFDIIIRSISNSPAARLTGLELYKYLKKSKIAVTQTNMVRLILSSLRERNYHMIFEYYVYEYLCLSPKTVSTQLIKRITRFSHLDHRGRLVLHYLEDHQNSAPSKLDLDRFWNANHLNKDLSSIKLYAENSSSAYGKIDIRDCQYLKYVLTS